MGLGLWMVSDLTAFEMAIAHNFTVIEEFTKPHGKFPVMVGDVVLVDCKSAKHLITGTYAKIYHDAITEAPSFHVYASKFDQQIRDSLEKIDFCKVAMTVNGQIKNQAPLYVQHVEKAQADLKPIT